MKARFIGLLLFVGGIFLLSSCTREERKIFFGVSSDTVTVYGYVKDMMGNPVPNAKIIILPTKDEISSDEDGFYRFSISLGELPADAVISYKVAKEGFVTATASISFAEILAGTNDDTAIQKRVKRQDVILYPPVQLDVSVVDKDGKPVVGALVIVFPSAQIANYLGITQEEAVTSVTSQATPVSITQGIPAIDFVYLIAVPPEDKEELYSTGSATVSVDSRRAEGLVALSLRPLEIVYSSVAVGQFISPDSDIKLIFSKNVTGITASLDCGRPVEFTASVSGNTVIIDPAGRLLGNCTLTVNQAFGENGETLSASSSYSFVAYDPAAPKGFACPVITVNPPAYGLNATYVSYEAPNNVIVYQTAINFQGFFINTYTTLNLIWDPPVASGIKEFKLKYISESDKIKGTQVWQDIPGFITLEYRPIDGKWTASWNVSGLDISNGEKYYIAAIPVNVNGEELCNPEKIENPFTFADNTGPRIQGVSGFTGDYSIRIDNIQITFSENITGGTIDITSRGDVTSRGTFNIKKLSESFADNTATLRVYLEPVSVKLPDNSENADGYDNLLVVSTSDLQKLWIGQWVNIYDAGGTLIDSIMIEAIRSDGRIWFSSPIPTDVRNGFIVPWASNPIQSPSGDFYVSGGVVLTLIPPTGLTSGDKIQVLDPITGKVGIFTIWHVYSTGTATVQGDISTLSCNDRNKPRCQFRSLTPDIKIKATVYDTSGNVSAGWTDETNHNGSQMW